jgi:DNA polymerase (family 10)
MKIDGEKVIRVKYPIIELNVSIAAPETGTTLLLIRTGSRDHNVRLRQRAKDIGMKLSADGSGLFRVTGQEVHDEERIATDTEESIFGALNLPYAVPEEREC